jgi:spondin-1
VKLSKLFKTLFYCFLSKQGDEIRTIIKARGISYPNVTGKTFAVFRVDSDHHLVSLVSMISPSPDWFVGVSGLELCLSNGSWVDEKILNLYPYDAGTDSGPTYTSSDSPTIPREAIRRIKPNQPNDPRSPFHDPDNKEMKPLARLFLTRQRLYEKDCEKTRDDDQDNDNEREPSSQSNIKNACAMTAWSEWSECDQSCGTGKSTRERTYRNQEAAEAKRCNKKLFDERECEGANCDGGEDQPEIEVSNLGNGNGNRDSKCATTPWTPFTECSKPCGKGQMIRTRQFVSTDPSDWRKCKKRGKDGVLLEEAVECEGTECSGDIDIPTKKPAQNKVRIFGRNFSFNLNSNILRTELSSYKIQPVE